MAAMAIIDDINSPGPDIIEVVPKLRKSGEKDIADALARLVTDIGYVVIALREIEMDMPDGVEKLISASRTFRNNTAALSAKGRGFRTMLSSGNRLCSNYLTSNDIAILASIFGTTPNIVAGVSLSVDISNRGIGISTPPNVIASERVPDTHVPELFFIFMLPRMLPEIIDDINTSIRTSEDARDKIKDMVFVLSGSTSANNL